MGHEGLHRATMMIYRGFMDVFRVECVDVPDCDQKSTSQTKPRNRKLKCRFHKRARNIRA